MSQQASTKQVVPSAIERLPDHASVDEVERGGAQIAADEGFSHRDVERRRSRWLG